MPFGKRTLTGIIAESGADIEAEGKLREAIEILDDSPVFSENMMKFAAWVADYYMASYGETLRAALPQGLAADSVLKARIISMPEARELEQMKQRAPKRYALLCELMNRFEPVSVGYLEGLLGSGAISAQLNALVDAGIIECERIIDQPVRPKMAKAVRLKPELIENEDRLKQALDELDKKALKQSLLLSHVYLMQNEGKDRILLAEAVAGSRSSLASAASLEKKGLIEIYQIEVNRYEMKENNGSLASGNESLLEMTLEQKAAYDSIADAMKKCENKNFMLYGVTGSGKTLVYIHAIRLALESGKKALLVVPEIALTPQLIDRFENVFPGMIGVIHSKMGHGERFDSWRSIERGEKSIVIGARSAIFAPMDNLGLIVVDEEHEQSFKQESPAPRYNARDCAVVRGRIENAVVVLGSATPSLESMMNASLGRYNFLKISKRADGASLPDVQVVDMLDARKNNRVNGAFSSILLDEIKERIRKKEGVILFQNRRGYAPQVECHDCGDIPMCRDCDVTLTYHKASGQLRCHYCGYTIHAKKVCDTCGGTNLLMTGWGTQKLEDELQKILEEDGIEATIDRMDLDTTTKKGAHRRLLQKFADGETDILIGTQMVAKGLDFERVTLVGVIDADMSLFIPDFRAGERTFQLLSQVAGRAGRSAGKKGKVVIQSGRPDNFVLQCVQMHDYGKFFKEEIFHREKALYPPFVRFIRIELHGRDEAEVERHGNMFADMIPPSSSYEVKGCMMPAIPRLKSNYRREIIIKSSKKRDPSGSMLRKGIRAALEEYNKKYASQAVKIAIDIDSYNS